MYKLIIILLISQTVISMPSMRLNKAEFKYGVVTILQAGLFPPTDSGLCFDIDLICSKPLLNGFRFIADPRGCYDVTCINRNPIIKSSTDSNCINNEPTDSNSRNCSKRQRNIVKEWFKFSRM